MLKNMKIRSRMLLSYAIIIVLTIVASVTAVSMLQVVGANLTGFYNKQFQTTNYAWAARRGVYAARSALTMALLEEDGPDKTQYMNDSNTEAQTMSDSIAALKEVFEGDMTLVSSVEQNLQVAGEARKQIMTLLEADRDAEAFALMKTQYIPVTDDIRKAVITIGEQADANAQHRVAQGDQSALIAVVAVTVLAVLSVVVGIFFALYISNGIRKPVGEIEQAARDLASGKLNTEIRYQSRDELGNLADSMRQTTQGLNTIIGDVSYLMREMSNGNFDIKSRNEAGYVGDFKPLLLSIRDMNNRLSDTLRQINETADQVSSGAEQVSSGAQSLSQGATEQASSVEELAAAINEITVQIRGTADNAQQGNTLAGEAGGEVDNCNRQMVEMNAAMDEISRSSSEIGKIIKTIEDIAFQTNILALNAAVEAARAGAAGKGFAVVADEVRNLATKSQEASKNTAALIEGSLRAVEKGTHLAQATSESLAKVVVSTGGVTAEIGKIDRATDEQTRSITQVSTGIDQISAVVQNNSAAAEESAAASEELSAQAQNLKDLVGRFQLQDMGAAGAQSAYLPGAPEAQSYAAPAQMAGNAKY